MHCCLLGHHESTVNNLSQILFLLHLLCLNNNLASLAMMFAKYLPVLASTVAVANGFAFGIFDAFKASPVLSEVHEYKMGDKFEISLDVGEKDKGRMSLNGLTIEMLQEDAAKDEKVGLPGTDGPHPQTSTGAMALKVHATPSFIDMFGTQKVRFEKACYEMIWKKVRAKRLE